MIEGRGTSRGAHDRKTILPHVVNALVVILVFLGVRSCMQFCVDKAWEWHTADRMAEIHAEQMRDQERFKTCVEAGLQPCVRQVQR